jgi:hypothetical protein
MFYRQDDLVLERIPALPESARAVGVSWLRRGAAAGRSCAAEEVIGVFTHEGRLYCRATQPFTLRDLGAGPVRVPPGFYRVRLLRAVTPAGGGAEN